MQERNSHQESQPGKHHINLDQDGFLLDPHSWNKRMARTIAEHIENGAIGERFDNDPELDLESRQSSVLRRTRNLTHL